MKSKNFVIKSTLLLLIFSALMFAQKKGTIIGKVTDASNGETLYGANILIAGTAIGDATDLEGKYRIRNVVPGTYKVHFRYMGYKTKTIEIKVFAGRAVEQNVALEIAMLEGEEVVVTGLLQGQAAAINQQLSSNTIVNVVSKDKIQELPDQNAAESIGRLPGVSIERNAGEGTKVVVRGLSPKFNSITINGERIPATDAENRSVDLSMISPDVLEGIEVFKALTPDKDADAVGGSINFVIKKASEGFKGNVRVQGGYNDHEEDYKNYKASFSLSDRFFNNKLGVIFTGNYQRANRSSDIFDASYSYLREDSEGKAVIGVGNLNLGDRIETRDRYGASLSLDYDLENGEITLSSLYGRTERDEVRRRKRYRVSQSYTEYWLRNREINTDLFTNSLSGTHDFDFVQIDWRTSYSLSKRNMPRSHDSQFRELSAFTGDLVEDQGPQMIPLGAKNDLANTFFKQDFIDSEDIDDKDFTAKLDFKVPFNLSSDITGYIKFGGKYRSKDRQRDKSQLATLGFDINKIGKENPGLYDVTSEQKVRINNFYDTGFSVGEFLNGAYDFGPALSAEKLDEFAEKWSSYYKPNATMDLEDYEAGEKIGAGYLMAQVNITDKFMILPGFRYEYTKNEYTSVVGNVVSLDGGGSTIKNRRDSVGQTNFDQFLPMVQFKYKATDWFDIRGAVTKSLSRPNYFNLVPWERISNFNQTVERGNPNLKPTIAWNYDLFVSFYGNFGLFTVGGFYKNLKDIDYIRTSRITDAGPTEGYELTEPENGIDETIVKGIEVELQTNLTFLPSPFDGIVLYINYSHITSETYYPYLKTGPRNPLPPFDFTFIDTVRSGKMPGQPDNIANIALGYEKGGFSGRLSMVYQGESLQSIGNRAELDGYTDSFVRWDLTAQYKFDNGISIYTNINNLSNIPDKAYLGSKVYLTKEEYFGWTADLGVRYKF
ncbi:MAG: TonB-dependent receptor [Rhodothermaceae bacterium]